nr:hypothetical protein BdHM001_18510 [Bdellovibrio sp. HM001]
MKLSLSLKVDKQEICTETIGIPCSEDMKRQINQLRKVCGKPVNHKIREFIKELIEQNKDKLEKAS